MSNVEAMKEHLIRVIARIHPSQGLDQHERELIESNIDSLILAVQESTK